MRQNWSVCSGEGTEGFIETRTATELGIKRILIRERCNGDRWARAIEMLPGETAEEAQERGLCAGFDH